LLGGEIRLASTPGMGSTFTLYIPVGQLQRTARNPRLSLVHSSPAPRPVPKLIVEPLYTEEPIVQASNEAGDDRADIQAGDQTMLIVENDLSFAKMLLDVAREHGMKGIVSGGAAAAISMVREHQPALISLDIFLPDMPGWRILDRLKADLSTRHIPICVVSTDDSRDRALNAGAIGFITKPVASREVIVQAIGQLKEYIARPRKTLALLMPPGPDLDEIVAHLRDEDLDLVISADAEQITNLLRTRNVDCVVVEPRATDLQPADLIDVLEQRAVAQQLPIVIYGENGTDALSRWRRRDGVFALREARSLERLVDFIYLFLHRGMGELSDDERRTIEDLHSGSRVLEGKKALIVDDDMRNIFALSTVLHDQGMEMVSASNGREAIRLVREEHGIDIVLMDIMMPEMDGMTTMREIRKLPVGKNLPIIAVTAKAMKGDREKCMEAGAWDYLSKPVDTELMVGVLRAWLSR
jgi:CheY-like chemotaxis protein